MPWNFPSPFTVSITTASSSPATLMPFLSSRGKCLSSDKRVFFSSLKNRFQCKHQAIYISLKNPTFLVPLPVSFSCFYCIVNEKYILKNSASHPLCLSRARSTILPSYLQIAKEDLPSNAMWLAGDCWC